MNMNSTHHMVYIHLAHVVFLAFLTWRIHLVDISTFLRYYAFCMVFMVEFELYREVMRLHGQTIYMGVYREYYFRSIPFLWGTFYGPLICYYEKIISH